MAPLGMQGPAESEPPAPSSPTASIQPCSPRVFPPSPAADVNRRVAIAVDLSDESAYAVKWAVQNYLRPGDAVVLLHVRSTSVLYGADWGAVDVPASAAGEGSGSDESRRKLEDELEAFTTAKAQDLARPLAEAQLPFKVHIVKDHDMKERLCLEVERLGLSAVIMGSRGVGASRRAGKGRLGSVSDYCVHHCVCPVVVVRYPEEREGGEGSGGVVPAAGVAGDGCEAKGAFISDAVELHPVPEEEEEEDHDAADEQKGPIAQIASPRSQ